MKKIKIMFYADSYSATSGYSKVGHELSKRIAQDDRFDVMYNEITTGNAAHIKDKVKIISTLIPRTNPMFIKAVFNNLTIFSPNIFFPIGDTFLLERDNLHTINYVGLKVIPYVMMDSYNLPDYSNAILDKADKILTGSKHGQKTIKEGNYESEVLFHGVDFAKYHPVNREQQRKLKEKFNCPIDKKLFLFIGRNFLRKRPQRLLEAIAKFNKKNPDNDAFFFIHMSDLNMKQYNITLFKERLSKKTNMDNILFSKDHTLGNGIPEEDIIQLYQACDFYLTTSSGEGFGLPLIEAMACKRPVIAPDNTTHSIFLADGRGILVTNQGYTYSGFGTYQKLVDVDEFAATIKKCLDMSIQEYNAITDKALEWIKENCDWDKIAEQLKEIFIQEVNKKNGNKNN